MTTAFPRVLPSYLSFCLRLRRHQNLVEYDPSKRYRKPLLVLVRGVLIVV